MMKNLEFVLVDMNDGTCVAGQTNVDLTQDRYLGKFEYGVILEKDFRALPACRRYMSWKVLYEV